MSIYDYVVKAQDGSDVSMRDPRGLRFKFAATIT